MKASTISVVIPVYNKRQHIRRAVYSVLRQSYQDFELIIIDDASTDGSMNELTDVQDDRIVTAERKVPGPGGYAARNLGTKMAKGTWIAFLDADDEWTEHTLVEYMQLNALYPAAKALCTGFVYKSGSRERVNDFTRKNASVTNRLIGFEEYLQETRLGRCPVHTSCVCISKNLLEDIGGFPEGRCRRGGDRDTWLRVVERTKIAWSSYIGEYYHCDSVNMVTKSVPEGEGCAIPTLDRMISEYSCDREHRSELRQLELMKNELIDVRIRKAAKDGTLSIKLLAELRFKYAPINWIIFALVALIPNKVQRNLIRTMLRIKSALYNN